MKPFPLSAFGDEAGASVKEQLDALVNNGITGLDVRNVDGINVLDLSEGQLEELRQACEEQGCHVQAIGSPINKVSLKHNTLEVEREKLERAIKAAKALGTNRIRIFSPEVPPEQMAAAYPEVRIVMHAMVEMASENDILLLHENDARYFGAFPENARRLFEDLGGPNFKAAFDFANTVLIGFKPRRDWFPWLTPYLDTLHIKDALAKEGKVVPAGEGDGELVEVIKFLLEQAWHGPLTLEPHLASAGHLSGFSGPKLFAVAAEKLKEVVVASGGSYEN